MGDQNWASKAPKSLASQLWILKGAWYHPYHVLEGSRKRDISGQALGTGLAEMLPTDHMWRRSHCEIPLCLGPSSRLSEELGLGVTVTSCSLLSALLLWLLGLLGLGKGDMIEQNSGPSTLGILEPWIPLPVPTCSKNQEAGRST